MCFLLLSVFPRITRPLVMQLTYCVPLHTVARRRLQRMISHFSVQELKKNLYWFHLHTMRHCVTLAVDSRCLGFRRAKFETNTDGVLQDTDCVRWWMSLVLFTQVVLNSWYCSSSSSSSSASNQVRAQRAVRWENIAWIDTFLPVALSQYEPSSFI